jgi:energy-coupling factor transport system ATP-binding protein
MIRLEQLSFWYAGATTPALADVSVDLDEGTFALVVGPTGSGKSTLLGALNGLVPHFTGGHVEGRVVTAGRDPRLVPPREFAGSVGVVGQDPLAGFVTDTVEEELAFGLEQLAVPPDVMRRRVEEMLDALGIAPLRRRALRTLSGGEQQRVAIGSALVATPQVLVLDEPTSSLDPGAAEDVLAVVRRLVHDNAITVVAAEHRLERIVEYADRVVLVEDHRTRTGDPAVMMRESALTPPVVELGRWAGWDPLPLSVRDARRLAAPLRDRIGFETDGVGRRETSSPVSGGSGPGLDARGVVVRYGSREVVRGVDLTVAAGEVVALMGRNGSGKSSLLWAVQGAGAMASGQVEVGGRSPRDVSRREAAGLVTLVPQQAADLLFHTDLHTECRSADAANGLTSGATWSRFLASLGEDDLDPRRHPRDLSEGQRLALALAVQLANDPAVVLLDEPTRGLDYVAKQRLGAALRTCADEGRAVVLATHDVEFVAELADRVVVLGEGTVVNDAPVGEALAGSMMFAPQVAKVFAPLPLLTVADVARSLPVGDAPEAVAHG